MQAVLSVFLITLGLGQLISTTWGLRGISLVGANRLAGYGLGLFLLAIGVFALPGAWTVLGWTLPVGPLAVVVLLVGGSYIAPPPHPNRLFETEHPAHAGCQRVQIPDGGDFIPGFLLFPARESVNEGGPAVCIIPGAGDTKTFFKWRLIRTLLAEGLAVLTIDTPGHGDYRHRPMRYPDCLSTVPAVVEFLQKQPGVTRVGLVGISLGGAIIIRSLVENASAKVSLDALAILETPVRLRYTRALFYRELWATLYGSPLLSLLQEVSVKQIWQEWHSGGYCSPHNTGELFELLNPLAGIGQINNIPLLLVYSRRDRIATPEMARMMQEAAPHATLIQTKKASHVMLTLIPSVNRRVARWLQAQLNF
ncbi:MAG: alpha/beta fold hydrolase [Anaerolineae bacterium]|nr:alpha/beta fold hydrolase [Anaerolineae bacterium]